MSKSLVVETVHFFIGNMFLQLGLAWAGKY